MSRKRLQTQIKAELLRHCALPVGQIPRMGRFHLIKNSWFHRNSQVVGLQIKVEQVDETIKKRKKKPGYEI